MNKISIFLASPISGFDSQDEFQLYREEIKNLINKIKSMNEVSEIFSAAVSINTIFDYDDSKTSVKMDLEKLNFSTHFILLYPKKIVTSALIELGYAIAKNKKILIVTTGSDVLPYMMKNIDEVLEGIEICYFNDEEQALWDKIHHFIQGN